MKTNKVNLTLLAIALFAMLQVSFAQDGKDKIAMSDSNAESKIDNWILLGSHVVDYTIDRDVITLNESGTAYTSLKFNVKGGPINLHKCTVHFKDSDNKDISFGPAAGKEYVFDLKGNTNRITKITFWYDTKGSADQKATIEVFGKR